MLIYLHFENLTKGGHNEINIFKNKLDVNFYAILFVF